MTLINRGMTLEALAATISQALEAAGIRATLSGGSAVSVYAMNEYESDAVSHWIAEEGQSTRDVDRLKDRARG